MSKNIFSQLCIDLFWGSGVDICTIASTWSWKKAFWHSSPQIFIVIKYKLKKSYGISIFPWHIHFRKSWAYEYCKNMLQLRYFFWKRSQICLECLLSFILSGFPLFFSGRWQDAFWQPPSTSVCLAMGWESTTPSSLYRESSSSTGSPNPGGKPWINPCQLGKDSFYCFFAVSSQLKLIQVLQFSYSNFCYRWAVFVAVVFLPLFQLENCDQGRGRDTIPGRCWKLC